MRLTAWSIGVGTGVLAICGCGGSTASRACEPSPIHTGAPPSWTAAAFSSSSPGFRIPYALASGDTAAAFFFAPRLRAGHPTNPTNKILWVVRYPRNGNPLVISAQLGANSTERVTINRSADSSPGEIYPSFVDLPRPGCWKLTLRWGPHRTAINVQVVKR